MPRAHVHEPLWPAPSRTGSAAQTGFAQYVLRCNGRGWAPDSRTGGRACEHTKTHVSAEYRPRAARRDMCKAFRARMQRVPWSVSTPKHPRDPETVERSQTQTLPRFG